jgi:hypothetical protein
VPEIGAAKIVHLGFAKLVKVPQEFKHVGSAASGELKRRSVVAEVLAKCVPVSALLGFISARPRTRAVRIV